MVSKEVTYHSEDGGFSEKEEFCRWQLWEGIVVLKNQCKIQYSEDGAKERFNSESEKDI